MTNKDISHGFRMNGLASIQRLKTTGIVLGLYIAALLLSGPLHPLAHGVGSSAAEGIDSVQADVAFDDAHATIYTLHSCPACFLNSHPALGADFPTADINTEFKDDEIPSVDSEFNIRIAFSPISSRAPPVSL